MARVHYPTNAGQAWARREAIGGDARPGSEVPILLKSVVQWTAWAQCIAASSQQGRRRLQYGVRYFDWSIGWLFPNKNPVDKCRRKSDFLKQKNMGGMTIDTCQNEI